jgi:hypothetical protein
MPSVSAIHACTEVVLKLFQHWGSQLHWLSGERSGAGLGQGQLDLAIQWMQSDWGDLEKLMDKLTFM